MTCPPFIPPGRRGGKRLAARLEERGYAPLYRGGEVNRCPGCGRSNWHVGRSSAECAFCGTALAIAG